MSDITLKMKIIVQSGSHFDDPYDFVPQNPPSGGTPGSPLFSLDLPVPEGFQALIREKRA
jgi:hypothetical protein